MSMLVEWEPVQTEDGGYEIFGASGKPVVAVLGGISASRHVAANEWNATPGWWECAVGAGRAIDSARFRILSIDYPGSAPGAGPATSAEQAENLARLLKAEGINRLYAIVGASYGGMVALAFGAAFPGMVGRLVVISAAHETSPFAAALRFLQRRIVELGLEVERPEEALIIARGLAMTSYSTPQEFRERFRIPDADFTYCADAVGDYLLRCGRLFAESCSAARFLALSRSLDSHRVAPEDIRVRTTVIAVRSDALVPIESARELAARLGAPCTLVEVDSVSGHDAFLNDAGAILPHITESLERATEQ